MPRKNKRIEHWDDERSIGNGIIVTLRPGYAFTPHADERSAEHVRGFDTVGQAIAAVVCSSPCTCGRCSKRSVAPRQHKIMEESLTW